MEIRRKPLVLVFGTIVFVISLLIPTSTLGQITSHYGAKIGDSGSNLVGFDLTISSPISKEVYSNTVPLVFNLHWSPVGVSLFFNWTFSGIYTYRIDNNSPVSIESNQSSNDIYGYHSDFKYNPSFSYLLDVSNLANGQHSIVISAGFYYKSQSGRLEWQFLNETSSHIWFQVQNSIPVSTPTITPTPTPSVPEFSWLMSLPLFIFILSIVAIVRLKSTWRITQN